MMVMVYTSGKHLYVPYVVLPASLRRLALADVDMIPQSTALESRALKGHSFSRLTNRS